jgi:hypothetical protein
MIVCIIIACIAIYLFTTKKETLVNIDHSRDDEIAALVYEYVLSSQGGYADYYNFLKSIHNTNPNLSDMETYYKFKALKMINKLSKTSVLEQISGKTIILAPKVQSIFPF